MAISFVGAETNGTTASVLPTVSLNVPTGTSDGDLLLAFIALPRHDVYYRSNPLAPFVLLRYYTVEAPTGWFGAANVITKAESTFLPTTARMFMFYRIATSSEPASYTFETRKHVEEADGDDDLRVHGTMLAYSGVATASQPFGTDAYSQADFGFTAVSMSDGGSGTGSFSPSGTTSNTMRVPNDGSEFVQAVIGQGRSSSATLSFATGISQRALHNSGVLALPIYELGDRTLADSDFQTDVLAGSKTVNAGDYLPHDWTYDANAITGANLLVFALNAGDEATTDAPTSDPDTGDPPPSEDEPEDPTTLEPPNPGDTDDPGRVGATGTGSLIPEANITNPLITEFWGEQDDALTLLQSGSEAPQIIGAKLSFNGLGACISGTCLFPGGVNFEPYDIMIRLKVDFAGNERYWYAGLVENFTKAAGITDVTVKGPFQLLNEAQIDTTGTGSLNVEAPSLTGVIEGARRFNFGRLVVVEEDTADEFQTWSSYLGTVFSDFLDSAWGVGPDLYYVQGTPKDGGYKQLHANTKEVVRVQPHEYVLSDYATRWYAEDSTGAWKVASRSNVPLLTPRRIQESKVNSSDTLITPGAGTLPTHAGPTYDVDYAGIAIPPILITNLPNGDSQYAASAEVNITMGQQGTMPTITTRMRTVALPVRRAE